MKAGSRDSQKSAYHFELPEALIAQKPLDDRDQCRLFTYNSTNNEVKHRTFHDLLELIPNHSLLVLNDTRVLHSRIKIRRPTGGNGEILLLEPLDDGHFSSIAKPSGKLKVGMKVICQKNPDISFTMKEYRGDGQWIVGCDLADLWPHRLQEIGEIPLPPYIQREAGPSVKDEEQYQSVFAANPGSSAAPTAGLHFTRELLDKLVERGIEIAKVTLHIGIDTFKPIRAEKLEEHQMHSEYHEVSAKVSQLIKSKKDQGHKIIAVGTTVVRSLESARKAIAMGEPSKGQTRLFLRPPQKLEIVDHLITNFHLPESSLLMLVSTLIGREKLLELYREAIEQKYRFFSYGDAMYISD